MKVGGGWGVVGNFKEICQPPNNWLSSLLGLKDYLGGTFEFWHDGYAWMLMKIKQALFQHGRILHTLKGRRFISTDRQVKKNQHRGKLRYTPLNCVYTVTHTSSADAVYQPAGHWIQFGCLISKGVYSVLASSKWHMTLSYSIGQTQENICLRWEITQWKAYCMSNMSLKQAPL